MIGNVSFIFLQQLLINNLILNVCFDQLQIFELFGIEFLIYFQLQNTLFPSLKQSIQLTYLSHHILNLSIIDQSTLKQHQPQQTYKVRKNMSIIQLLTRQQRQDIKQLNLSSTLPTKIYQISNLQRFICLKTLNLSNNCISKIQNLSTLKSLKVLNLQFNQLTTLENIQSLQNLQQLMLSYNSIESISPSIECNKKLRVLQLSFNELRTIQTVMPVFGLQRLIVLSFHGNPFLNTLNYIQFIKLLMPNLLFLDQKDLNTCNLEGQLYPQEQVAILRDTLNKLLDERNHLAEQIQNLTNLSSPAKINLKQYLKIHRQNKQSQQNSLQNSNIQMATFSPQKHQNFLLQKKQKQPAKHYKSIIEDESSLNIQGLANHGKQKSQKQKMIQILRYWLKKIQQKSKIKKQQAYQLHEYYTNIIKQKKYISQMKSQKSQIQQFSNKYMQKNKSKEIFNQIKQKQSQLNSYKKNSKAIKQLIKEIQSLSPEEQMYKILMIRILFGHDNKQKDFKKRQLNYRQLKHFLLSQYGLLNALNDINKIVFGQNKQFSVQTFNQLKQLTKGQTLIQIVKQSKSHLKQFKRQKRQFQKQKQKYLQKLQKQTEQLYKQWQQLNETKKQFQFDKGKQIRYQNKLLQQKQKQMYQKLAQIQQKQKLQVQKLIKQKQYYQQKISQLQQKHQDLEEKYQRKYVELQEFQKQFNSFKEQKQNMVKMQDQLVIIKKELFQKENILLEINEKIKHLSLNQQINTQRVKFLQRKCYQKSQQIKSLDEQQRKYRQKIKKLIQQSKIHSIQLNSAQQKIHLMHEQQKSLYKNIQRHKSNLTVYEQKLKNLNQLQSHKKKSIQQLQLRIQDEKNQFVLMNQKNLELQEILAQKQQNVHSYKVRISEHKKSLQSFTDISKNIQQLMQRQTQLKKSILQLEIQNGNLQDLKNQLLRDVKNISANKGLNQWAL